MALTATIYKVTLSVADMNRSYFHDHALTIARHPSETDERVAVRLLAFALHAHERLEFGKGLSADDEPALWLKTLTGEIQLWIDVGQPEEKRLRKACGRADQVIVYNYGGRSADLWWQQNQEALADRRNISIYAMPAAVTSAVAEMMQRTMTLHVTAQDDTIWINDGKHSIEMALIKRQATSTS